MLRRAGLMVGLALCASLAACGGDDDNAAKPVSAVAGSALLAQIPTLGETYPAQLARFVDTDEGKDYGLAVTVADDGQAVAYLCDGKTLGRAFSGAIEDGAASATLKAVKGDGTVDLELAGDEPSSATVKADDFGDEFTLASTKVGGYYREEVKGVTRGWVVSDALAIKGVSSGNGKPVKGTVAPPPPPGDQELVSVQEDAQAPPETAAFLKSRRCARFKRQYDAVFGPNGNFDQISGQAQDNAIDDANLALARGRSLGCDWAEGETFVQ